VHCSILQCVAETYAQCVKSCTLPSLSPLSNKRSPCSSHVCICVSVFSGSRATPYCIDSFPSRPLLDATLLSVVHITKHSHMTRFTFATTSSVCCDHPGRRLERVPTYRIQPSTFRYVHNAHTSDMPMRYYTRQP